MNKPKYIWNVWRIGAQYTCMSGNGENLAAVKKEIAEFRRDEKRENGCETDYSIRKWSDDLGEYAEVKRCVRKKPIPFHPLAKKEEDKTWIDRYAEKFAGNSLRESHFSCWCFNDKEAPEWAWGVYALSTRDSRDCWKESNNAYILNALKKYRKSKNPTVFETSFSHWGFGYINVLCVQVYQKNGEYTKAFKIFAGLMEQLENSNTGLLDEDDAYQREYEAGQERLYEEMKFHVRNVQKRKNVRALCREFCEKYDPDTHELYDSFPYEALKEFLLTKHLIPT